MRQRFSNLNSLEDISILKGTAFEDYLADVFEDLGYTVDLTPKSGDYGADLLLSKDEDKIAVQAKQYSKPVGFDAIKEVHFARSYYSTSQAWVIATNGFTPQAIQAAENTDVRLIDGRELLSLAMQARAETPGTAPSSDPKSDLIDNELLKACILVVKNRNALPVYLQSALHITPEKATRLLKRMESLGVTTKKPNGRRSIISKKDFICLVDEHYDASATKPRFCTGDYSYEVFRGDDPDSITIVESPTTYPTFYSFEYDAENAWSVLSRWACVGIDAVEDTNDIEDIRRRKSRVASLKLYDVINLTDETETVITDPKKNKMEERRICKDFNPIDIALYSARTGHSEIRKPGSIKQKNERREAENREAQERREKEARELESKQAAHESNQEIARFAIVITLVLVSTLGILSSCSGA